MVVVPAVVPMLPGLSIYRGLSLMSAGDRSGVVALATAAAVAISIASGVILGEYVAQPLKREVRRLEDRLAGPRLVGPIRARAVKRQKQPGGLSQGSVARGYCRPVLVSMSAARSAVVDSGSTSKTAEATVGSRSRVVRGASVQCGTHTPGR